MRRRAKVDSSHAAIRDGLRQLGYSVQSLAEIGKGCPDLLVGKAGQTWLVEVKAGKTGRITPDQHRWYAGWRGRAVVIATSLDEALEQMR